MTIDKNARIVGLDAENQDLTTGVDTVGKIARRDEIVQGITQGLGHGSIDHSYGLSFFGHNYLGAAGDPTILNNDRTGLVFFTRPRMNLSYDNLIAERTMIPMLSSDPYCIPRICRSYLDPVGAKAGKYTTPSVVDPDSAFIQILSNKMISLKGWPDPSVQPYTSKKGRMGEEQSQYDGYWRILGTYDLDATFRNGAMNPIGMLMMYWNMYGSLVKEGWLDPYPEFILRNEMDYNTRIYRLTLDPSRRYVREMFACGASFPTGVSMGSRADYDEKEFISRDLDTVSARFRCMGAIYNDPILVTWFNATVVLHCPAMAPSARGNTFIKIPPSERQMLNYWGYPYINEATMELEWWMRRSQYNILLGK